ncbi:MAG: MMPL family transporter [Clostridiales bacterium]|nr:MMPL family transporter [Clostridiales bacterium]
MRRKIAKAIVRYRTVILVVLLLVAVWAVPQISRTRINYDLTRYLSDSTMTKQALKVMNEEFGATEQLSVMFADLPDEAIDSYTDQLKGVEEIRFVQYDPASDIKTADGVTYRRLRLTLRDCDAAALVEKLRAMFPDAGRYWVGGSAAQQMDVQRSVGAEIPEVMLISVAVVVLVLLLTSHAWFEPALLLVVFAVSILINMGTNFLFPDVSFITFAVCAILQLALSIDYAIMLLHTWNNCCDDGLSPEEAMVEALSQSFMRITSSAFTTIAGLLSLLFMSFTIGFDIGLVLSKGILISMLGVFLLMPALTLLLKKPLQRTRHKPVRLNGARLGAWIWKARKPVAAVLVLLVLCGAFLTANNTYSFMVANSLSGDDTSMVSGVFGVSNPLVLLVPGGETDEDYDRQRELVRQLETIRRADGTPALREITAMVTTGADALRYYTPADVAEMTGLNGMLVTAFFSLNGFGDSVRADALLAAAESFAAGNETVLSLKQQLDSAREVFIGEHYQRMILDPAFTLSDPDFTSCMEAVLAAAENVYGKDWYATGSPMSTYDIGNAFRGDLMKVNLITFLAILFIVVVSFRALLLPLILVFVIEGAIWISMGLSRVFGISVFFMCYLICLSIQMGATIDYGILLSDQYRALRRGGASPKEALQEALSRALPTVLTSGIILMTAGFIIGIRCSIYYISSIGLLVSRGACMSVLLVLTLLPALLALFDRRIMRKGGKP